MQGANLRLAAVVCLLLCLAGGGLYWTGLQFPVYADIEAARQLRVGACDGDAGRQQWQAEMPALLTWRHPLMQSGISLILAAMTWFGLLIAFPGRRALVPASPRSAVSYFSLGLFVMSGSLAAQLYSLDLDLRRGVFPWCADSIAIPAAGLIAFYGSATILALPLGALLVHYFAPLPIDLAAWDSSRSLRSWMISTTLVAVCVAISAIVATDAFGSAFLATPFGVIAIYIVAATRAALVGDGSSTTPKPEDGPSMRIQG